MADELYKVRGDRHVSCDPARGEPGGMEYTGTYIIVAGCKHEAKDKALKEMNSGRYRYGVSDSDIKELQEGKELPLESRINVLKEFFKVIE